MVKIRSSLPTTLELIESPTYQQEKRTYLGMSLIGHECHRFIWYQFRWAFRAEFSARMMRLFARGHREEPEVIKELEKIGVTCHSFQQEITAGWGHIKGHCDGICEGVPEAPKTPHLLEIKTMSDKNFKEMCKKGCKLAHPKYFGQCMFGMHAFKLTRALFIVVNKNDDAWYVERIKYDKNIAEELEAKGEAIILAQQPPPKAFSPTWYLCKFCDARFICHYGTDFDATCRTCTNVALIENGGWSCQKHEIVLTTFAQEEACDLYDPIPNT